MIETSKLQLRIFDGTRQVFSHPAEFMVTIMDGNQTRRVFDMYKAPVINFDLPFFDNFGDHYVVNVSTGGYRQAGFAPIKLSNKFTTTLDLMLVAKDPGYSFVNARWPIVAPRYPFLGSDTDAPTAEARYENMMETEPVLACLLNLIETMGQIHLPQLTPLDYIKQVRWDKAPTQDRFFAYCDAQLLDQVRAAAAKGLFAPEPGSAIFHPGATASWKQVQFGEANVQLTFHENPQDRRTINGVDCVTLEPDMDYYRDPLAHTLLEVFPNGPTHTLTNPVEVYMLRWIAGRHAGVPEFAPLYTLT